MGRHNRRLALLCFPLKEHIQGVGNGTPRKRCSKAIAQGRVIFSQYSFHFMSGAFGSPIFSFFGCYRGDEEGRETR